jgi:hypothetical protein
MDRISFIASLTKGLKSVVDCGIDHGYTLIAAIRDYGVSFGYGIDVNKDPLEAARINIEKAGLTDKTKLILSDGLQDLEENIVREAIRSNMQDIVYQGAKALIGSADLIAKHAKEQKFTIGNSLFSRGDLGTNGRIHEYQSLKPMQSINLESPKKDSVKRSKISNNFQNNTKFTFKIDTINDSSIMNEKIDSPFSKKRKSSLEKRKNQKAIGKKSSIFACSENINKIKSSKTAKKNFLKFDIDNNNKRSNLTDNKLISKERLSKGSEVPIKSQQNLNFKFEKEGAKYSLAYFAKEKKEDCKLQ